MKKVILGMALAGLAMIAYKKVPFVQSTCGKLGNGAKKIAKKLGEALVKTEVRPEGAQTSKAPTE